MSAVEEWGVENEEGIYVMSEDAARDVAKDNEDQTLVCKINGEWVEVQ